jgi:hypothetical protein
MRFYITNAPLTNNVMCKRSLRLQCYPKLYFPFHGFGCKDETYVSCERNEMTAQCGPICFTSKPAERMSIYTKTKGLYPSNTTAYSLPLFKHGYMFRQNNDHQCKVKCNVIIFTLDDPVSSQQLIAIRIV